MKINQIQSQLAVNRDMLGHLHREMGLDKALRDELRVEGQTMYADFYHKETLKHTKRIAKLAALQKALKKDLARELAYERAARVMDLLKVSAMSNVGETF